MAIEFKLPEVSEGVESADIAEIHVSEGDTVEADQVVMELETEKAVAELRCPHAGKVTKVHVSAGDTVKVGQTLLTIEESAEAGQKREGKPAAPEAETEEEPEPKEKPKQKAAAAEAPAKGAKPSAKSAPAAEAEEEEEAPPREEKKVDRQASKRKRTAADAAEAEELEEAEEGERTAEAEETEETTPALKKTGVERAQATARVTKSAEADLDEAPPPPAGPSTRRLARELGVDLSQVRGSGRGGRITTEDVQEYVRQLTRGGGGAAARSAALPDFSKFGPVERKPLSKLAKTAAANLSTSWQMIPHVTQHDLADITTLEQARRRYLRAAGDSRPKVTITAILVKALVAALKEFPHFNSSLDAAAGALVLKRYYHIGVAVDTPHGLLVPVIRDADRKSVLEVAEELAELAARARERKLALEEMQGATFTISNLGGIGGTAFTPIVNFPEVAILGVSRTQSQIQLVDGKPVERLMLPLSLSYDHRVINGADAARFVSKLAEILCDFFQILVES